jgi:putative transposase
MATVVRGYKTELDLNNEHVTACLQHAGTARFAYNWGLAQCEEAYRTTKKFLSARELHRRLNALKATEYPWMYDVSKCAAQEALRDLEQAYKNAFRRCQLKKQGKFKGKVGFPTFKKRSKRIGSFTLTGSIHVFEKSIQLPRLGTLRLKERDYLPQDAHVLSATVSEHAGRWYVSVQVKEEQKQKGNQARAEIGIDLGIKTLATLSDGTTFENPRALKHHLKQLRRLEREKSRRTKGGKNRAKSRQKLACLHACIAHLRENATHQLTTYLCKNHALVAIETLAPSNMLKNHTLAQAVADSNFGEIKRQLLYKSEREQCHLVMIDRWYPSSKTCSSCGTVRDELTLSERTFVCFECGYVADRDYNAAKNILQEAYRTTDSSSGSHACEHTCSGSHESVSETGMDEAGTKHHVGMS